jgi:folate-binding protein YgfZ
VTTAALRAAAVCASAGLFARHDRGRIEVRGEDRVRWLNGMVSNDVAELSPGPERSGCYALLLTPKARIVADLHVFCRAETLWLDLAAEVLADVQSRLEARIIADDVVLQDTSADWAMFDILGPDAFDWLARAGSVPDVAAGSCVEAELAGAALWIARVGARGDVARLWVPAAARGAVASALWACAEGAAVEGDAETLEALRIEAGVPRLGADFGEDAFPEEAGLVARAVSLTKGCFTGQEIVARIESRGQVKRRLVPLAFEGAAFAPPGTPLLLDGAAVGEVTSAAATPSGGRALGYVRLPHDAPGVRFEAGAHVATVVASPASP